MKGENPAKTYRQMRMVCHILQSFGYTRTVSLDSFRKPNFILVADILYWICGKFEPNHGISANINGETERVFFIKQTLSLLASKIRINVEPLSIYYADYRCIPELLKILRLFYNGPQSNKEVLEQSADFTLPLKFDKRKTKDLTKDIIQHGQELFDLLGKKEGLNEKMDHSIDVLEQVLKQYNQNPASIEEHIKKLVVE